MQRRASSLLPHTESAVREALGALRGVEGSLGLCFASPGHDLDVLAAELGRERPDLTWLGCSTAGEVGPMGCSTSGLVLAVLPGGGTTVEVEALDGLEGLSLGRVQRAVQTLIERTALRAGAPDASNSFALLLVDGLAKREELLASAAQGALGAIRLLGGSAGDDLAFERTRILVNGHFGADRAALALVRTDRPFRVFRTQHFTRGKERMVVTEAQADIRRVLELNGDVAAHEYARLVGIAPDALGPEVFSRHPVVFSIGGEDYVRSIQRVGPGGSLDFYCAIETGVVLSLAQRGDLICDLAATASSLRKDFGEPELTIAFDCILRQLEIRSTESQQVVQRHFEELNAIGFATYGEQLGGLHMNQTLTAVALGAPEAP